VGGGVSRVRRCDSELGWARADPALRDGGHRRSTPSRGRAPGGTSSCWRTGAACSLGGGGTRRGGGSARALALRLPPPPPTSAPSCRRLNPSLAPEREREC
jgi:hypothetical protein